MSATELKHLRNVTLPRSCIAFCEVDDLYFLLADAKRRSHVAVCDVGLARTDATHVWRTLAHLYLVRWDRHASTRDVRPAYSAVPLDVERVIASSVEGRRRRWRWRIVHGALARRREAECHDGSFG